MTLAPEVDVLISTLASLPMAAMSTDCSAVIRWANAYVNDVTGYVADEIIGHNAAILLSDNTPHPLHDILRHVVATGEAWRGQLTGRRKNGEFYDIDVTITPIRDRADAVTHALWTLQNITERKLVTAESEPLASTQDITARKRTEEALQQANESLAKAARHYRHMFNSGSDAVFVYNLDEDKLPGPFLEVNDNACRYLGYTREELLRMRVFDMLPPEEHSNVPFTAQRLLVDGQSIWEGELVTKSGPRIPVDINYHLSSLDGSPTIVAAVRDMTERKQIDEKLRLDGEIMNNIRDGVLVVRAKDGVIVHANKQSLTMCGYSHDEMIGMHLSTVNASTKVISAGVSRDIVRTLNQKKSWVGDIQAIRKDGTVFWCNAVITTFQHEKYGEVWVGVYRDATELKRAEVERVKLENQFCQAQKLESIGRLAGGVAHDFNNILTVINGYSDFLLNDLDISDPLRSFAGEIKCSAERASSLTKQLLAFSRK